MKKLMTLVLAVCMLLAATTAFADVLQDEKAPVLVGKAVGENVVYATVYDVEGNAIAITDKDQVTLIDISARAEDDALMNAAAKSGDFAAMNMIVVEKFYMDVEGAENIEATFALLEWQEVSAAFVTTDGISWTSCELTVNDDGTVTVKTVPSVVALTSKPGAAAEVPTMDENLEHGNFTPSVAAKPAPEFTGAVIVDGSGNVIEADAGIKLVVTPVSARAYTKDINVYDNLKGSFEAILNANSLEELGLASNMVVRDLFEVTMYGDSLQGGAFTLKVTFKADMPDAVAVNGANGWVAVAAENIVDNGDGTVTVAFSELGTVAFLVETNPAQNAVTSPAT